LAQNRAGRNKDYGCSGQKSWRKNTLEMNRDCCILRRYL
jgi:hypothetical protein